MLFKVAASHFMATFKPPYKEHIKFAFYSARQLILVITN